VLISTSSYSENTVSKVYSDDLTYIKDKNYTIKDILGYSLWNNYADDKYSLIINNDPIWVKFTMDTKLSSRLYLSLKNPLIDYMDLYIYQNGSLVENFKWGDHNKNAEYYGGYTGHFDIDPTKDVIYYAKIKSSGLVYFPFEIVDEMDFSKNSFINNISTGIFFGSLIFFVIYSVIMVFMAKEWLYLQYAGFTFGMFLMYAYQEGLLIGAVQGFTGVYDLFYPLILSIVISLCTIFNINYTQIKSYNKYYYYAMLSPLILSMVCIFLLPVLTINQLTIFGLFNFLLITTVSFLCGVYLSFYKKTQEGLFLFLSLAFFIPGSTLYVAGLLGLIETSFLPKYFIHIGHSIELLVWSIALGVKVYSMRSIISNQRYELNYDSLTKVHNRKGIHSKVNKIITDKSVKYFSVAILDIDYFKKINDQWGHGIGDETLVHFANFFKNTIRDQDSIGRWGGEEFILILPNTNQYKAQELISLMLNKMNQEPYKTKDFTIPLAFSAGIACVNRVDTEDYDFTSMLHLADKNLYAAKNNGRNQVCI
jgi:diguanylate cyclase (GGDEF)-like protein